MSVCVHVGVSMWEHVYMHVHIMREYNVSALCVDKEIETILHTLRLPMLAWTTFILLKRR